MLIDGGKGQLNAALKVLEALGLEGVDVAALAKQEELVFVPGKNEPVRLPEAIASAQDSSACQGRGPQVCDIIQTKG